MSDEPLRGYAGRFLRGSTANPRGRPKGSLNATTVLANQRLRARADKAARVLERCLNSPNEWVAITAARAILERAAAAGPEASDTPWIERATPEEIKAVYQIMKRCLARLSAPPTRNEMAELPGWHGTTEPRDDSLRYGDAFDVTSLPAPRESEPRAVEPDEMVIDTKAKEVE